MLMGTNLALLALTIAAMLMSMTAAVIFYSIAIRDAFDIYYKRLPNKKDFWLGIIWNLLIAVIISWYTVGFTLLIVGKQINTTLWFRPFIGAILLLFAITSAWNKNVRDLVLELNTRIEGLKEIAQKADDVNEQFEKILWGEGELGN